MKRPLKYILVGTGGWGVNWCTETLPRLAELGKAIPAAVDINPDSLLNAHMFPNKPNEKNEYLE
ncbi:MAG: hypothetical protein QME64_07580 [bacterium]|nr:hypothetical protein [bacterium]